MSKSKEKPRLFVLLGDQLFPRRLFPSSDETVFFMAEDYELCSHIRHHKHKLILFLGAMRGYASELRSAGREVIYHRLDDTPRERRYEDKLDEALDKVGACELVHFEIEDAFMAERIAEWAAARDLDRTVLPNPMFLTSRAEFREFASDKNRLLMADFYRERRRTSGWLMSNGRPVGGQYSFDGDNRKSLPRGLPMPPEPEVNRPREVKRVIALVDRCFPDHPGSGEDFWLPTRRRAALRWLDDFLEDRFALFGDYEDAISQKSATLFHSVLSPIMNLGLITPDEVVERALEYAGQEDIPLNSVEGFLRQIIGWREFVRGVYHERGAEQAKSNFFDHQRRLGEQWYSGTTGIDPLDHVIRKARERGWAHHIERLMIAGNLMTLAEIHPDDAYRWFMEMFVDSADWVMVPNVYGMALFADGGVFATKPYICGSNYLRKMSDFQRGPWCDVVDGLYWRFVHKHRDFFAGNPRLAMMPRALDRLDSSRRDRIFAAAENFIEENTVAPGTKGGDGAGRQPRDRSGVCPAAGGS
jgi:deoxyribodipyrimidine photolyase-related protein